MLIMIITIKVTTRLNQILKNYHGIPENFLHLLPLSLWVSNICICGCSYYCCSLEDKLSSCKVFPWSTILFGLSEIWSCLWFDQYRKDFRKFNLHFEFLSNKKREKPNWYYYPILKENITLADNWFSWCGKCSTLSVIALNRFQRE